MRVWTTAAKNFTTASFTWRVYTKNFGVKLSDIEDENERGKKSCSQKDFSVKEKKQQLGIYFEIQHQSFVCRVK